MTRRLTALCWTLASVLAALFAFQTPARADLPFLVANATLTSTHPSITFSTSMLGQGSCSAAIGTTTGDQVDFLVSVDGTHFTPANLLDYAGGSPVTSAVSGIYHGDCSAAKQFKVALHTPTGGSSVSVSMLAAQASLATMVASGGGGGISSIIGTDPITASTVSGTATIACPTCITSLAVSGSSPIIVGTPSPGTFTISLANVPVAFGGTGTASPAPVGGTCITITGTWPNTTTAYSCATPGPSPTPFPFNATATSPIVFATPSAGVLQASCPSCVTGLTAGSNVVVGVGPTPSVAVTAAPNFSALTVGSGSGCAILSVGVLSPTVCGATVTTSNVTMVAAGTPISIPVALGVGFPNLSYILLSDGTFGFIAQVTSGGGTTTLTANVLQNLNGSPGTTIASGSTLGYAGPIYTAGTGLTLSGGNSFAIASPVAIAQGGTNATSFGASNRCIRYDGTRLVVAANDCLTVPTLSAELSVGLGFASGTVATGTVYPYQQVASYTNGKLTALRVACATADSGQTIFSLAKNGTQVATLSMTTSATATNVFGSPITIAAGDVLHLTVSVAGTATSCGVTADGTQQTF